MEKRLTAGILTHVSVYVVRVDYLKKCKVVESYYIGREGNQEFSFTVPLMLGGGKLKYFEIPLFVYYRFTASNAKGHRSLSGISSYENEKLKWTGYIVAICESINRLLSNEHDKQRLCAITESFYLTLNLQHTIKHKHSNAIDDAVDILVESVYKYTSLNSKIKQFKTCDKSYSLLLFKAVMDNTVDTVKPRIIKPPPGRVIGWGVLGIQGRTLIDYMDGMEIKPTELWDIMGDGGRVRKPDIKSLTENDMVIIFSAYAWRNVCIVNELAETKCTVVTFDEISSYLASIKLPHFYDGNIKFCWQGYSS